ncbi:MAG: hypothetical protein AAFQ27_03790 [Pseudomonadota bacterium]
MRHALPLSCSALLLAACAGSSDKYPSLAVRDVERLQGQFTPTTPDPEPIRPIVSEDQLVALVMQARDAEQRFRKASIPAMVLAGTARDQSMESSARQQALVALADLSTIRSDTAIALAELDLLRAEAKTNLAPTDRIEAAMTEVVAILEGQDGTLAGIYDGMTP